MEELERDGCRCDACQADGGTTVAAPCTTSRPILLALVTAGLKRKLSDDTWYGWVNQLITWSRASETGWCHGYGSHFTLEKKLPIYGRP